MENQKSLVGNGSSLKKAKTMQQVLDAVISVTG